MIANSGHDEKGGYSGGQAGDQTGTEWQIQKWYNRPWDCVLRYPDIKVGMKIAELARQAANNNNIGYNQGNRLSFWYALEKAGYQPKNIKTKCDADCSAGVTAIVKAVGYLMGIQKLKELAITNYTGSMKNNYKNAGFKVLTDERYLISARDLIPGDILLNEKHHTCINLDYYEDDWIYDTKVGKWWYRYKDGTYPKGEWVEIKNEDYYFDDKGWLLTDQYIKSKDYATNGKLYYVDDDGAWDGHTYYWKHDDKGWWLESDTGWYPKSEWCFIAGKWYYFKDSGYMATGTLTIDGKIYSFNKDGALVG